mgnify:CR=1 FL=1
MIPKPLDFGKVEVLRRHMLLTSGDMAKALGVSRVTYYGWLRGKPIRRNNEDYAKKRVRHLLAIMTDHLWPTPEIVGLDQKERSKRLLDLLQQYQ